MRFRIQIDRPPIELPSLSLDVAQTRMESDTHGLCDLMGQTILLNEDNGPDMMRATLIHEVIHACIHNIGVESEHDERTINGISNQLLYFLQNNPAFVEYLSNREAPFPERENDDDDPDVMSLEMSEDVEEGGAEKGKEEEEKRTGQGSAPRAQEQGSKGEPEA